MWTGGLEPIIETAPGELRLSHLITNLREHVFVWRHIQRESGTRRPCELRGFILSPGLEPLTLRQDHPCHGRVFTSEPWPQRKLSGRLVRTRRRAPYVVFHVFVARNGWSPVGIACTLILRIESVFIKVSCLCPVPQLSPRAARYALTVRNCCFPAPFPPRASQVGYMSLPSPLLMTADHLTA